MRYMILLPLLFLLVPTKISLGQSCNPAAVHYIVRDEKGRVLSAAELKTVAELLPKKIDDADTDDFEVSLAADKKTFYWQDSTEGEKGTKVPALSLPMQAPASCTWARRRSSITARR